ncbi:MULTISPECIES: UPF0149 family protein [Ferrimonas]|uniref:UPF0149 family protein n=1 Tax=Ferrimonas TaxID=44011 RepID=UPI00040CE38D|nr:MULTISPECIES: UPF0149 family protein [Ferrimonas]USD36477.1 UPF0149 family protein [Ferrimonas sp. SCSIO 43195]
MSLSPQKLRHAINRLPLPCEASLNYYYLHGFISAVVCAPTPVLPSHWLAILLGPEQALDDDLSPALVQLYQQAAAALKTQALVLPSQCRLPQAEPLRGFAPDSPLAQWAAGFEHGLPLVMEQLDHQDPDLQPTIAAFASYGCFFANLHQVQAHCQQNGLDDAAFIAEARQVRRHLCEVINQAAALFLGQHPDADNQLMEHESLIEQLTLHTGDLPEALLNELQPPSPLLVKLAQEELQLFVDAPQIDLNNQDYIGHWHSLWCLADANAHQDVRDAIDTLLRFHWHTDSPMARLFEHHYAALAQCLGQLFNQAPGYLMGLLKQEQLDTQARSLCLGALAWLHQQAQLTDARLGEALSPLLGGAAAQANELRSLARGVAKQLPQSQQSALGGPWPDACGPSLPQGGWPGATTLIQQLFQRYQQGDKRPVDTEPDSTITATHGKTTGRNDPCPCGSGKKYKKCCG